jgi:DinB family protein
VQRTPEVGMMDGTVRQDERVGQRGSPMPLDPEIHAANRAATARIRAIGERLTDDQLRTPVGEHWTVAITLAHLAFWDRRALDSLQRSVAAGPEAADVDIVVNDLSLPLWAAIPPRDAVRLALDAATATDAFVATLDGALADELLASHVRWVRRSLHRNEHLDDAEAALRG